MARRKGATKSRNVGARKANAEASQLPKEDTRLKDDPGGKNSHVMDEPKLISSTMDKVQSYRSSHAVNNVHRLVNRHNSIESSNYRHHGGTENNTNNFTAPSTTSSTNCSISNETNFQTAITNSNCNSNINNNNSSNNNNNDVINNQYNNTSKPSSDDLKYLHKKFKRIASATYDKVVISQPHQNQQSQSPAPLSSSLSLSSLPTNRESQNFANHKSSDVTRYEHSSVANYSTINNISRQQQEDVQISILSNGDSVAARLSPPSDEGSTLAVEENSSNSSVDALKIIANNYSSNSQSAKQRKFQDDGGLPLQTKDYRSISPTNKVLTLNSRNNNNNNNSNSTSSDSNNFQIRVVSPAALNNHIISGSVSVPSVTDTNFAQRQPHLSTQATQQQQQQQQQRHHQQRELDQSFNGRYVCPYCNLNCTKPSVLQKHIRAHTNERPYPCETCGFAFKTKSNYYKHCRSRAHALRVKGGEPQPDDDGSMGSDQEQDPELSNSSSDVISRTASPMDERTSPAVQQAAFAHHQQLPKFSNDKPYKPKFHSAAFYAKEELTQRFNAGQHNNHQGQNYYQQQPVGVQHYDQQQEQLMNYQQLATKPRLDIPHHSIQQQMPSAGFSASVISNREPSSASSFVAASSGAAPLPLNVEFLQEHISKIISQNEAIVENKEILLQKKYPKMSGKSKNSSLVTSSESSSSKLALALANKQQQQQQQQIHLLHREDSTGSKNSNSSNSSPVIGSNASSLVLAANKLSVPSTSNYLTTQQQGESSSSAAQPLNLTKMNEPVEYARKRSSSDSFLVPLSEPVSLTPTKSLATHPQNPERSIIKHLLLNARGLGVPNGEGEDAVYTCPLCQMEFRTAEDLKLHTSSYCQGGPSSAPISPVGSPSLKYFRSKSINVNLPEFNNPNSLAKLARSSLLLSRNPLPLAKLAWSQLKVKPSNLVLHQLNINTNTTSCSSSSSQQAGGNASGSSTQRLIDAPLPSPGPLLGKTPLVEAYNTNERRSEEVIITKVHEEGRNFSPKRLKFDNYPNLQQQQQTQSQSEQATQAYHMNSALSTNPGSSFDMQPTRSGTPPVGKGIYSMCGGEVKILDKKEERMKRFMSSGGCIIPISECPDAEVSPKMIRTPLLSGGSFTEMSPKSSGRDSSGPPTTPKMMIPVTPLTPSLPGPNLLSAGLPLAPHFQFPPINSITAFNPLTLPPVTMVMSSVTPSSVLHGDKLIPFVPGIPGPNTLAQPIPTQLGLPPQKGGMENLIGRNVSPNRKKTPSPIVPSMEHVLQNVPNSPRQQIQRPTIRIDGSTSPVSMVNSEYVRAHPKSPRSWAQLNSAVEPPVKRSFNFTRMADNLSPRKMNAEKSLKSPDREVKHYNFENLISKAEIPVRFHQSQQQSMGPLHVDITSSTASITLPSSEPTESEVAEAKSKAKSKFLRPTSLPLKPGTFTPKCHHGITPTANTLPLISPETPRPSKACIQLYLNGHAYTYLGLKCSTKMFYCTVNCPQASYIANLHKLSMYSVWQVCAENNPHPLGLKPKQVMSLYDSRQRTLTVAIAKMKSTCETVHSQPTVMTPFENNQGQFYHHQVKSIQMSEQSSKSDGGQKSAVASSILVGGYESNENYTYIRGRGRGRYVCSECGIRCKKPSMLKKHIRTHTDVRPYTCKHCSFSFKTKGNLTKHMQSKTHYKKCLELGINPGPMPSDSEFSENDCDMDQQSITSGGGRTSSAPGESDSDEFSDGGDAETESSDTDESKSRLPEHEAARCLLSLSMTPPSNSVSPHMFHTSSSRVPNLQYPQLSETASAQNNHRPQLDDSMCLSQPLSSRRVVSFTSPKPPFDYQKQEQYYSNPIIPKGREEKVDETSMKPIDLTKPRQMNHPLPPPTAILASTSKTAYVGDMITSESGLLKSLVSITDKIRTSVPSFVQPTSKFNDNVLLQAYLTEQALQYTKIKQSQMSRNFLVPSTITATSMSAVTYATCGRGADEIQFDAPPVQSAPMTVCETFSTMATPTVCSASVSLSTVVDQIPTIVVAQSDDVPVDESEEPLSSQQPEDAETVQVLQQDSRSKSPGPVLKDVAKEASDAGKGKPPPTVAAKSVASEYLKMTSAEYLKSRTCKTDESEESGSDQEVSASESNSSIKPPSDFTGILARTVIVGEDGFKSTSSSEVQPMFPRVPLSSEDGRPVCTICSKTFQKQHQMVLHMNIHYMERKFKCEPCAVSFRTQGHLQKHERSEAHKNKVMMTSTFGVPTTSNPRPFECSDCKVAFRIHGHLAKHLRSKTHVQKLECLQKLPFGTYAEIERAGISLTEIDTTDCDNSLASLKVLAQKLIEKDPSKLGTYTNPSCIDANSSGAVSHESGSEDSPEAQQSEDASPGSSEQSQSVGSVGGVSNNGSNSTPTSISGVKRKFDSFSSTDSASNVVNSQELGPEKRPKTTSET